MTVDTAETRTGLPVEDRLAIDAGAADRLFLEARTASAFSGEPVTDEDLQAVYELTRLGPTMMNNQPLRITWVRSPEAREELVGLMAAGNQEKTRTAPAVAVLSYDTEWHEHFATFFPHAPERRAMFESDAQARAGVGRDNAWMQAGYFVLAARAVGLAAGPMGGFDAAGVDARFNTGTSRRAFLVVAVGRPAEAPRHPRLPRLGAEVATETV